MQEIEQVLVWDSFFNTKVAKSAKGRGYKNEEQAIEPIAEIAADAMVQVQLAYASVSLFFALFAAFAVNSSSHQARWLVGD
jgi:hypothetical protein